MRGRGLIILVATIPTWVALFVLARPYMKAAHECNCDLAIPPYLMGISDAAFIGVFIGVLALLIDLISWFTKRNVNG